MKCEHCGAKGQLYVCCAVCETPATVTVDELLAVLKELTPDYPLSTCPANAAYIRAQAVIAKAGGR